jgi:hypothetical protein
MVHENDDSIEYQGSWNKQTRKGAVGEQVRRSARPGDSFRLPFTGSAVSLVMPSGPGLGVIEVCIDPGTPTAACRIVDLSTLRKSARRVVTNLRDLAPGDHVLQVTARQAPVELDAIAIIAPVPEEPVTPAASAAPAPSVAPPS